MFYKSLIVLCCSVTSVFAQSPSQLIKATLEQFPAETQISVAYTSNGEDVFKGFKNTQYSVVSEENSTQLFQIGSISKVFTSIILADLHLNNKVDLNQDISKLAIFDTLFNQPITLKSLANHTSGLPRLPSNFAESAFKNQSNPYLNYRDKELLTYLKKDLKLGDPSYQYSNLGTGLLGFSLEFLTKQSYEDLLQTHVIKPLGMLNTTSNPKSMNNVIKGLDAKGELTSYWTFDALKGVGDIFSSAQDMLIFSKKIIDKSNAALNLTLKQTHQINERQLVGLGWNILKTKAGFTWYWHNGAVGGFTSTIVVNPDTNKAVVVLSNVSAYHPDMQKIDKLCFDIMINLEKS
ncbi:serine hydrolase domain-containing protein [Psychroflexus sp. ALD_RP9]|uniref:serine hydrolase domain-containing protein n=1 Tax=Psychroflexus sp. ALD_RP9 TaxID=2777186 RepID=UPI001A8CCF68|nr:serine hydrolase domain-containing protein [Psychroflexus sp. ALD_RP9]QSS97032.1 beta-lactamase family protein [Psychroflexus sp. ALD_RP9]